MRIIPALIRRLLQPSASGMGRQSFETRTFHRLKDFDAGRVLSNMSFHQCLFDNCSLSRENPRGLRSEVRDVQVERCKFVGNQIGPAIFVDVTITDSTANDLSIFWGSVFRRVTFAGTVSAFKINRHVTAAPEAQTQALYDASRRKFYEETDWAIDISKARFTSFDCEGIPARLFRLDPETQGVVRRENVPSDWFARFYQTNAWGPWVQHLLATDDDDAVLAAPLTKPKKVRDRFLEDLRKLRDVGIVDPPIAFTDGQ